MDDDTPGNTQHPLQELSRTKLSPEQRQQKKRMIRWIILLCLCLIPFVVWLETSLLKVDISLPISSDILIFALTNLNVILVLLMFFLILRNLAELFFESRQNVLGSKLKTKLVISFISLSLIPTILLFFISLQFVSTSMDYWFNSNIEISLENSLELAKAHLHDTKEEVNVLGDTVEKKLRVHPKINLNNEAIENSLAAMLKTYDTRNGLSFTLISEQRNKSFTVASPLLASQKQIDLSPSIARPERRFVHAL